MKDGSKARVLLVDDDPTFRQVMAAELSRRGYTVVTAATGREALERSAEADADVTLLDLQLPDMDGVQVLARLREQNGAVGVVVLTGHGTIDTAVQAIRLGAFDYLQKPCPIEKVEIAVQKTYEHVQLVKRQRVLEDGYAAPDVAPGLIGASPPFMKLLGDVARVARTEATTLILGETGAGKDVVATLVHAQSPRRDAPFVVVDCAALHEELLQSELFGHEKGAFTGAMRRKHGLFEVANGGTLFLDEVGDTSADIQAKLLRVLECGRFRRLGGTAETAVDVRVVAATNRDLRQAIARGHFRQDLFYRLATFTLLVPPLRERRDDIPLLIEHFTQRLNARFGFARRVGSDAVDALMAYAWPGNVRELLHVLEQALVLCRTDVVGLDDLPPVIRHGAAQPANVPDVAAAPGPAPTLLREVVRRHLYAVVDSVGGNRAKAARLLGMSERTLYRLLEKNRRPAADGSSEASLLTRHDPD